MVFYRQLGTIPAKRHTQASCGQRRPLPRGADGRGGLLLGGRGEVTVTDAGRSALGTWEPLPRQGPELIHWWGTQLGKAERLVLDYLATQPHRDIAIEEIAERTGYSATSGGFRKQPVPAAFPRSRPRPRNTADLHPTRRLTTPALAPTCGPQSCR